MLYRQALVRLSVRSNIFLFKADQELAGWGIGYSRSRRFILTHNTLLREKPSWPPSWNFDVESKIWLSVDVFLGYVNLPAKFHPDPFWNDGALSFLKRLPQQQEEQDE